MQIVESLMNLRVIEGTETMRVIQIAQLMREHDVGSVVITRDRRPIGIITDRDVAMKCVAVGLDAHELSAADIMSSSIFSVSHKESLYSVLEKMQLRSVRRMVITSDGGDLLGIISLGDILKVILEGFSMVSSIMSPSEAKIRLTL